LIFFIPQPNGKQMANSIRMEYGIFFN